MTATRRQVIGGMAGILAASAAPAAIIRSALGARGVAMGGNSGYTARDYVQDGLVYLLDGIENAGYGIHDSSATKWTNLIGDVASFPNVVSAAKGTSFDENSFIGTKSEVINVWGMGSPWKQWIDGTKSYGFEHCVRLQNCRSTLGNYSTVGLGSYNSPPGGVKLYEDPSYVQSRHLIVCIDGISRSTAFPDVDLHPKLIGFIPFSFSVMFARTVDGWHIDLYVNGTKASELDTDISFNFNNAYYLTLGTFGPDANEGDYTNHIYSARLYSDKALTPAEIAANYAIDKARFGLP